VERERKVKVLLEENAKFIKQKQAEAEAKSKVEQEKQDRIKKFYHQLEESRDLADNLQELTKFLHEFTGATGVYVGKLEHPRLKIEDKDNDKAHINREAPKEIKFIHASPEDH
jgi:hypothetical protein